MSALLLALAMQVAPPADWAALPVLPLPQATPDPRFVRAEIAAGRCTLPPQATAVAVPVAVLIGAGGDAVQVTPRAIGCATVEQFTTGLVAAQLRNPPPTVQRLAPGWHRVTITFQW